MRLPTEEARARFAAARVARLATVGAGGRPHLVPMVFALSPGEVLYSAVDHKPKTTTALHRLVDIAENPRVCVLADHYDEDWSQLWWVRADGVARVLSLADAPDALELLSARYPDYRDRPPPGPVIAVQVERWSGWSAG